MPTKKMFGCCQPHFMTERADFPNPTIRKHVFVDSSLNAGLTQTSCFLEICAPDVNKELSYRHASDENICHNRESTQFEYIVNTQIDKCEIDHKSLENLHA